ncbi:hypothetical protein P170DRAFT_354283 [Aspergillus steynii IBT 23096]|uniref:CorA-like transporter domain-containing protein n=1 Tax=Aspergillus steynii IBT 23096 TaxID=1392250 RepID=A0A2I2GDH7_9EURO|nr:uncharacterized protein P170DRAFT_354283 [Aspergillus steynii IBT 23096]PLB50949.1 hypothetical protein P170DRAFT_354283 [Aspergillus steynii IBT 23096]
MGPFSAPSHMDHHLAEKIASRSHDLFNAREGRPQLEVTTFDRRKDSAKRWSLHVNESSSINELSQLHSLTEDTDACAHIYTIRHLRSWTTLNISRELFERLLATYNVFPHFWKTVLTFGRKTEENEYAFPTFRAKGSRAEHGRYEELTYVIRRVERNNRSVEQGECPWSIRQTGVYHKLRYPDSASEDKSVFILVAPSRVAEGDIAACFQETSPEKDTMKPAFVVHERLVMDSLKGWMEYMAWLEEESKQKSNRVLVSDIDSKKIYFSADDRQRLKQLEDYITDLIVILQTMNDTVSRIGKSCQRYCEVGCQDTCSCRYMVEEFEACAAEIQIYLQRAEVLKARVRSTEQLVVLIRRQLSDLLGYEETRALKRLAQISHDESHNITELTKQSVKDAAAVKMLTIVGLVYLPTTIVANFFSTEFVKVNDQGDMNISREVWIMAVCAIPLTFITIGVWWFCVRYEPWTDSRRKWNQLIDFCLRRKRKEEGDLEGGIQRTSTGKESAMFSLMTSFTDRGPSPKKPD